MTTATEERMTSEGTEVTQPRVLMVDDRPENLVALQAILQGIPVETVAVGSGDAALKQLLLHDFALILMDAQMPDMDGFETARRIKQRERTRGIPIVFLTAADYDAHLALRGYAAGAVDYLTKPIDPWVLRAKVSVLAELWDKNRRVRTQAALTAQYERRLAVVAERIEQAQTLVSKINGDPTVERELAALLGQLAEDLQQ
jgi:CheY-like chemotaxis protein